MRGVVDKDQLDRSVRRTSGVVRRRCRNTGITACRRRRSNRSPPTPRRPEGGRSSRTP
jgi:hypothetical protein